MQAFFFFLEALFINLICIWLNFEICHHSTHQNIDHSGHVQTQQEKYGGNKDVVAAAQKRCTQGVAESVRNKN